MNNSYSALMVDMRHSRCLSDSRRQSAQEDLANAMDCTNELFKTELEMPLMFSAGDELQGLFRSTAGAFLAYRFIKILVQTVDLRGGIGVGEWKTRMQSALSTEQDGSAYHRARRAIAASEKDKYSNLKIIDASGVSREKELCAAGCLEIIDRRNESQRNYCEVVELLRPLMLHEGTDATLSKRYTELLRNTSRTKSMATKSNPIDCAPVALGSSLNLNVDSIRASHVGLAGQMGVAMGKTRQGLEKSLRLANVVRERELAAFAVHFLNELEMA